MTGMRAFLCGLISCAVSTAAVAQTPAFDPSSLRNGIAGAPTQLLVLGTPHLGDLPAGFDRDILAPLLDRLAAFKPDIVTIEALSGQDCDLLVRYVGIYPGVAADYCRPTDAAFKATGLDIPAATAAAGAALAAWPVSPSDANRRHLCALFLAANDRASALVQWLRLPPAERRPGDGLDDALVAILGEVAARQNENYLIGATLAARLGLDRVYPVDDHSADLISAGAGPDYEAAIQKVWSGPNPLVDALKARAAALRTADDMIDLYRFVNSSESQRASAAGDFGAALKQQTPALYGRQYVAWWETRNLRMAANIRSAIGNRPGARVLVIVGSSHKAYFDAYLNLMHDIALIDVETVLR